MADEVTKKDLQSLQGWVNAELKKRDAAIDKKRDIKTPADSDLKTRIDQIDGGNVYALKQIRELEDKVDKLRQRLDKMPWK